MEMGPISPPDEASSGRCCRRRPGSPRYLTPRRAGGSGTAEIAAYRESIRLAFVTVLQHLPDASDPAVILCDVLRWQASEVAELLDTTVPRSRAPGRAPRSATAYRLGRVALEFGDAELLERYVELRTLRHRPPRAAAARAAAVDAPVAMWLQGAADIGRFMLEPGPNAAGARSSLPTSADGCPAFGQ